MDDLIVKYLTDKLDADESMAFAARLEGDADYRDELKLTVAALAVADLCLDAGTGDDGLSDTQCHEPVADETK